MSDKRVVAPRNSWERALVVALGFHSLLGQVLLFRELSVAFGASELAIGLGLAAWLGWTALGAWRLARRFQDQPAGESLALACAGLGALLILQIAAVRACRPLIGVGYGEDVGLWPMVFGTVLLLLPYCMVSGTAFALASRAIGGPAAYALETAGSFAGGLASSALAGVAAPVSLAAMAGGVIVLIASGRVCGSQGGPSQKEAAGEAPGQGGAPKAAVGPCERRQVRALALAALAMLAALLGSGAIERSTRRWQFSGYRLVGQMESRYGFLAVTGTGSLQSLYEDGQISASWPLAEAVEPDVHFPMLAHGKPGRVLLLGGGITGALAQVLAYPGVTVDLVLLDPRLVELLRPHLDSADARALDDSRVRLHLADGRAFLAQPGPPWDVILVQAPPPLTARANRFYTREFFRLASDRLATGGILSFAMPLPENYVDVLQSRLARSVAAALRTQFGDVSCVPGGRVVFLASRRGPPALDAGALVQRLAALRIPTRVVTREQIPLLLQPERVKFTREALAAGPSQEVNSDLTPMTYMYTLRAWVSRYTGPADVLVLALLGLVVAGIVRVAGRPAGPDGTIHRPSPSGAGQAAVATLGSVDSRETWRAVAAIAVAGWAGMVLEMVVVLLYQNFFGALFLALGMLFAAFMLGTALGSARGATSPWALSRPLAALALLCAGLAIGLPWAGDAPRSAYLLLLLGTGALVGVCFPAGVALGAPAATLYAADLSGAALGALVSPLALVPLAGFGPTLALTAGALVVAALIAPSPRRPPP